jgi:hypothetical protein
MNPSPEWLRDTAWACLGLPLVSAALIGMDELRHLQKMAGRALRAES